MKKCFVFLCLVAALTVGLTALAPVPHQEDRSFTAFWARIGGIGSTAFAQDVWHETDQITIEWDPVTMLDDGQPVPAEDTINYTIHLKEEGSGAEFVVESKVTGTSYLLTLPGEGQYRVGIQAARLFAAYTAYADISWSDDGTVTADGQPFGIIRVRLPAKAVGLRKGGS